MKKIILLVLLIVIASCKSRKVEVQESKEVIAKDVLTKKLDSMIAEIEIKRLFENITIEPVDPEKPNELRVTTPKDTFTVSGNNTRFIRNTETVDSTATTKEGSSFEEVDKTKSEVENKERFVKAKSDWEWIKKSLPWIAITVFLIVGYLVFRKMKK